MQYFPGVIAAVTICCIRLHAAGATEIVLVPQDAEVRAFVPLNDNLGTSWTGGQEPFDDHNWVGNPEGVGYAGPDDPVFYANIGVNLALEMYETSPSAFIRIPFLVD